VFADLLQSSFISEACDYDMILKTLSSTRLLFNQPTHRTTCKLLHSARLPIDSSTSEAANYDIVFGNLSTPCGDFFDFFAEPSLLWLSAAALSNSEAVDYGAVYVGPSTPLSAQTQNKRLAL
jgi:hypothetical protein